MAQHGYLHDEYDRDFTGDDDRERGERWGDRDDDRGMMFDRGERDRGGWGERDRGQRERGWGERGRSDRDEDRGFFSRMGDRFSDDDDDRRGRQRGSDSNEWFGGRSQGQQRSSGYGREHGFGGSQGDYRSGRQQSGFGGRGGDWERAPRTFSSHPDDHYRSWRDRQVQALDRDYEDYCREREQQFHQDFSTWRQGRQQPQGQGGQDQSLRQGQRSASSSEASTLELGNEPQGTVDHDSAATLGTNNSENRAPGAGRGRR